MLALQKAFVASGIFRVAPRIAGLRNTTMSAAPKQQPQQQKQQQKEQEAITSFQSGVVFEPMVAAKAELATVGRTDAVIDSLGRSGFNRECEAAINEQINMEYNNSYIYHALYAYFDRDNVALPGMAKFFKDGSLEERGHAEKLMVYQNLRGGRVSFKSILMPEMEFNHAEKGDALYAMELALSLEKLNFAKLRELHAVASKHDDVPMAHFIEDSLLTEQVEGVKQVSEYVSQLRRVGKGLGVYEFDRSLA
ncbi:hypothetical protein FOA52_011221 [Chlamydomonas sp. UWO 241]|nr:hypothetical protein FOA52_011221 [Chlamydomonas sp. UWO 241]